MVRTFTFDATHEWMSGDIVTGSAELRFVYTFSPGCADYYVASIGGPGGWQPGDPDEIDIVKVLMERFDKDGKPFWSEDLAPFDFEEFSEWAYDKHYEAMCEEAAAVLNDERYPDV